MFKVTDRNNYRRLAKYRKDAVPGTLTFTMDLDFDGLLVLTMHRKRTTAGGRVAYESQTIELHKEDRLAMEAWLCDIRTGKGRKFG
jgi:hypothetical protein